MKSSEIIARVREGVFTHSGPKADMLMSTTPSTLALIIPASFWLEASLLSIHDSPPTSLTLWQSDGPSF